MEPKLSISLDLLTATQTTPDHQWESTQGPAPTAGSGHDQQAPRGDQRRHHRPRRPCGDQPDSRPDAELPHHLPASDREIQKDVPIRPGQNAWRQQGPGLRKRSEPASAPSVESTSLRAFRIK
jgi:hypothetical protein